MTNVWWNYGVINSVLENHAAYCNKLTVKWFVTRIDLSHSISEKHTILDNRLSIVKAKLNELKQELTEQISKCHDTLTSKDKAKSSQSIVSTIVSTMNEEKDKERRWLNLIIHNAPESTAELADSRKTEDIDLATDIFNVYLGAKATVTKALRLGKKTEKNIDKPRLMKVTVDTLESKAFILHNCTKLRNVDQSSYYSNIYITPDLTPTEREPNRQLWAKLDDLDKDGKQYKIKNRKIVLRGINLSLVHW